MHSFGMNKRCPIFFHCFRTLYLLYRRKLATLGQASYTCSVLHTLFRVCVIIYTTNCLELIEVSLEINVSVQFVFSFTLQLRCQQRCLYHLYIEEKMNDRKAVFCLWHIWSLTTIRTWWVFVLFLWGSSFLNFTLLQKLVWGPSKPLCKL